MLGSSDMRVLVTGGRGLVGKAIETVNKPGEWYLVGRQECDLLDVNAVEQLFQQYQPTHVLHLAAKVGGLFANMKYKADFLHENMLINDNVLHTAAKYQCKVVSCLSTCIFPDKVSYPITEEMIHQGPPHASNYGYAYAKRMIDVYNKMYNEQFGLCFTSAVPTNIYGPHDNYHLENAHVIPALIHKCYLAKQNDTPFEVMGSGQALRQFIFSEDLARLMVWMVTSYNDVTPLILSTSEEIAIGDIARMIAGVMDYEHKLVFVGGGDGQLRKPASNARLMALKGDFEFTPFEEGLKKSVEWFVENYSKARK